ncbi:MAG TPA: redoxin domain-containing protein [Stellaceae bacterium]|jgi:peroxiredoxin|nr:redoxin domain-containing protein [Stellaceae bacterium]
MAKLSLRFFLAVATSLAVVIGVGSSLLKAEPLATPHPGAPAPLFAAKDIDGGNVNLHDYLGKIVILEWTNDGCPFVGKHYNSGNMQALQQRFTAAGDIWLTIASSAPGEQGYVTAAEARADMARWHAAPTDFLLDPDGVVGRLYGVRATPTMAVIDPKGVLAYIGAIDDKPSTDLDDVKTAKNYVAAALDELASGKPVSISATLAYGCSVKYKSS